MPGSAKTCQGLDKFRPKEWRSANHQNGPSAPGPKRRGAGVTPMAYVNEWTQQTKATQTYQILLTYTTNVFMDLHDSMFCITKERHSTLVHSSLLHVSTRKGWHITASTTGLKDTARTEDSSFGVSSGSDFLIDWKWEVVRFYASVTGKGAFVDRKRDAASAALRFVPWVRRVR